MEQAAATTQHPRQLVIEQLRIQLAGNAEARRVVQDGIDRIVCQRGDVLRDIGVGQLQASAVGGIVRSGDQGLSVRNHSTSAFFSNECSCATPASRQQAAK